MIKESTSENLTTSDYIRDTLCLRLKDKNMQSNKELSQKWLYLLGGKVIDENLFKSDLTSHEAKILFKKYVKIINLEPFSYCNRSCSYCPVSLLDEKSKTFLDENYLKTIINDLKFIDYSNRISLNLYNEPLADEFIFHVIGEFRKHLPRAILSFNSNGDYVSVGTLKKLSSFGLNSIHITLHTLPHETYSDSSSLLKIKKFYKKLNVKPKIDSEKENEYIRTSFNYENLEISVETTNYDEFGDSRAGLIETLIDTQQRDWPCARPYREFFIFSNGYIYPCCQVYPPLDNGEKAIGSLKQSSSIFDIYTSRKLVALRKHLFGYGIKKAPCAQCSEPFLHKDRIKLV